MHPIGPPGRAAQLDALRRRLYRPDASAEDVERYRRATGAPREQDERAAPAAPRGARGRRPVLVPVLVALTAAALAAGVLLRPAPSPVAGPPTVRSAATVADAVEQRLRVPASERAVFAAALRGGAPAGLRQYLVLHPAARPAALDGVSRADSAEWAGRGPGAVRLEPSRIADRGGRLTLVLLLDTGGAAGWSTSRVAVRTDHRQYRQVVAAGSLTAPAGAPVAVTVRSSAPAPTRLAIDVPPSVRWGAVVVFTD